MRNLLEQKVMNVAFYTNSEKQIFEQYSIVLGRF